MPTPLVTKAFAYLVPVCAPAAEAIQQKHNRLFLSQAPPPPAVPHGETPMVKLNFARLRGSRCIMFGSSPTCHCVVKPADDVSPQHFALHFDPRTATLLITDLSKTGTRINMRGKDIPRTLKRVTWPVIGPTYVSIGAKRRLRYLLLPTPWYTSRSSHFWSVFETYCESIDQPRPPLRADPSSVPLPLRVVAGNYVCLYPVAHNTFAVLRASDGRLFVAKHEQVAIAGQGADRAMLERDGTERADGCWDRLLGRNHPNLVTLIDHVCTPTQRTTIVDFVPGDTLTSTPARLDCRQIRSLLRQGLFALDLLHRLGFCFRQLTSSQILLVTQDPFRIRVDSPCHLFYVGGEDRAGTYFASNLRQLATLAIQASQEFEGRNGNVNDEVLREMLNLSVADCTTARSLLAHPSLKDSAACKRTRAMFGGDDAENHDRKPGLGVKRLKVRHDAKLSPAAPERKGRAWTLVQSAVRRGRQLVRCLIAL
ncbi:hypothetical protein KC349_g2988 [Hortaea werneckii]|nr:hypothetical protein KC349_g2988 [Hortaea werneckii]